MSTKTAPKKPAAKRRAAPPAKLRAIAAKTKPRAATAKKPAVAAVKKPAVIAVRKPAVVAPKKPSAAAKPRARTARKPAPALPESEERPLPAETPLPKAPVSAPAPAKMPDKREVADVGEQAAQRILGPNPIVPIRGKDLFQVAGGIAQAALKNPRKLFEHYGRFLMEIGTVLQGKSKVMPDRGDRRWWDPTWAKNPAYGAMLQIYLAGCRQVNAWLDDVQPIEDDNARAKFLAALINDALAPTNTFINPTAIRRFIETGGASAVKGVSNLINDLVYNEGWPSQVNKAAFTVGKNLATLPGKVVFKNEMIELIQYAPQTERVYSRPLLVVPPQINKFYVFDLSPEKSVAQFLVEMGISTFVISWRNPTAEHRDWGFDDYLIAVEEAIDAVSEITGSPDCNIAGACSGGVTIAMLLAYFAGAKKKKVNAVTLLVSVFDATTKNVLGLFATEASLEAARRRSHTAGVLEGKDMAKVFSLMRPNDLIWNYWVNNYLLGNDPPTFDILYWNNDTTRLPAKLHGEMLTMYKHNPLVTGKELVVRGMPVDLKKVKCDVFSVGGVTDHITPWDGCYKSVQLFGGKVEFVLSNSGHIQSILNPPGNAKATYYTNPDKSPDDPEEWRKTATKREDTWWYYWMHWLRQRSGQPVEAPKTLGSKKHPATIAAPGTYVFEA